MIKDISCPHCKKSQNIQIGLKSDENLNVICQSCYKIILCILEKEPYHIPTPILNQYQINSRKELLPISSQEEIITD
jgi:hypothetical protein